jgi:hypothetical protein
MPTDKKIILVYDYISPNSDVPNCLNYRYLNEYIKGQFDNNFVSLENINSIYQDGISVWDGNGEPLISIIDSSICISDFDKNDTDNIYFYIVCPFGGASCAYGYDYSLNQGFSFFHFISKSSLDNIRNCRNFYLFINYQNEGTIDYNWFKVIYEESFKFNIPLNKIIFCASDFNLVYTFDRWFTHQQKYTDRINLLYSNWSLTSKSTEYIKLFNDEKTSFGKYSNDCSIVTSSYIDVNYKRPYRFLMFNRRLRPHRIYSILFFYHKGIIDDMLISYDLNTMQCFNIKSSSDRLNHVSHESGINKLVEIYSELIKNDPKRVIDYDDLENVWGFNFENKEPYLDSYIHITAETNFFEVGGYFSEKTWKPIGNLQPFIMMGSWNSLHELKKLGFKTFHPFIDESYDSVVNNEERFSLILNEIYRLSKLPINEIHDWYHSIYEDVLLYNQTLLLSDNIRNDIGEKLKNDIFILNKS